MVVNQQLFDAALRHQVALRRLATSEVRQILELLERSEEELVGMLQARLASLVNRPLDIRAKRFRELIKAVRRQRVEVLTELRTRLKTDLYDLALIERDFERRTLTGAIPIDLELASVPFQLLRAAVNDTPFAGGSNSARTLDQWIDTLAAADQRRLIEALQLGLVQGETIDSMVRRVRGTRALQYRDGILQTTRRNAEAVIRTGVNHVSNAARELVWSANEDLILALRWTATLDGRTSLICASRDGHFAPVGRSPLPSGALKLQPPGARPPAHPSCRSVMIAIMDPEGFEKLMPERPYVIDSRTRRRREIDFRARAKEKAGKGGWRGMTERQRRAAIGAERLDWSERAIGRVPGDTSYEQWLSRQHASFQDDVLGVTKGKLFRGGKISLDQFIDRKGAELSLRDLASLDPDAFLASGLDPDAFIN